MPVIGCVIYLITQVYNKRDAEKLTNEITHIINPTKRIKDLEKQLAFSDSYQNRVNLADAYLEIKDYQNAMTHYEEALDGNAINDFYVIKQLIEALYQTEEDTKLIAFAEKINSHPEFKKSRTQFLYGLALKRIGELEAAEVNLKAIDVRYSFYEERFVLSEFLLDINKKEAAKEILETILSEAQHMTKPNKRLYNATITNTEKLLESLV